MITLSKARRGTETASAWLRTYLLILYLCCLSGWSNGFNDAAHCHLAQDADRKYEQIGSELFILIRYRHIADALIPWLTAVYCNVNAGSASHTAATLPLTTRKLEVIL